MRDKIIKALGIIGLCVAAALLMGQNKPPGGAGSPIIADGASGTANNIIKFGTDANTITDSSITDDGTTVDLTVADISFANNSAITFDANGSLTVTTAAANASVVDIVITPPLTAAGQTTNLIDLSIGTNPNHTGGTVNAILIGGITGDADATENALNFGDGYDNEIYSTGAFVLTTGTTTDITLQSGAGTAEGDFKLTLDAGIADGASGSLMTIAFADMPEMDATGTDVLDMLVIDPTNADHTGGSFYALRIDDITGDAQATEAGILIETGYDMDVAVPVDDSLKIGIVDADVHFWILDGTQDAFIFSRNTAGNPVPKGKDLIQLDLRTPAMDGTDTIRAMMVNSTYSGGSGAGNNFIGIEFNAITGDAQVLETGVVVESGFDVALRLENAYTGVTSVGDILLREEFDRPYRKVEEDFTAAVLTDGGENLVLSYGSQMIAEYRLEQEHTTDAWVISGGVLNIDGDNTDNEGVEIYLADDGETTTGWLDAQTELRCFTVDITIADVSDTDQLVIGWRGAAAYDADNVYQNYTEFISIGIKAGEADGSIYAESNSAGGGAGADDSTTDWGDTETKTLKACLAADGTPDLYLDGTRITLTAQGSGGAEQTITSGTLMNPFISFMNVGGGDPGIDINYWEITGHSDGN